MNQANKQASSTEVKSSNGHNSIQSISISAKDAKSPAFKLGSVSTGSGKKSETNEEIPIEASKKDILEYLDKLIGTVQWLVFFSYNRQNLSKPSNYPNINNLTIFNGLASG